MATKPKPKFELYASKSAMKKHEGSEGAKMTAMEKKMAVKDKVMKPTKKKAK